MIVSHDEVTMNVSAIGALTDRIARNQMVTLASQALSVALAMGGPA